MSKSAAVELNRNYISVGHLYNFSFGGVAPPL